MCAQVRVTLPVPELAVRPDGAPTQAAVLLLQSGVLPPHTGGAACWQTPPWVVRQLVVPLHHSVAAQSSFVAHSACACTAGTMARSHTLRPVISPTKGKPALLLISKLPAVP